MLKKSKQTNCIITKNAAVIIDQPFSNFIFSFQLKIYTDIIKSIVLKNVSVDDGIILNINICILISVLALDLYS